MSSARREWLQMDREQAEEVLEQIVCAQDHLMSACENGGETLLAATVAGLGACCELLVKYLVKLDE
jgi:hypothetical protein